MESGDPADTDPKATGSSASRSSQLKKDRNVKAKGGSSKKMTQKEQSERFIETAQTVEAEIASAFDDAVSIILPIRPKKKP